MTTRDVPESLRRSSLKQLPKLARSAKFENEYGTSDKEFKSKITTLQPDWADQQETEFDENGLNVLHHAIVNGYEKTVFDLLTRLNFDINAPTKSNEFTPLSLGLSKCEEYLAQGCHSDDQALANEIEIVNIIIATLIEKNPLYLKGFTNYASETVLHSAAKFGSDKGVDLLVENEICDYMQEDDMGNTAIMTAVDYLHPRPITIILKHILKKQSINEALQAIWQKSTAIGKNMKAVEKILTRSDIMILAILDLKEWEELLLGVYEQNTIMHVAAKYGFNLQILKDANKLKARDFDLLVGEWKPCDLAVMHDQLRYLDQVWEFVDREDWSKEIETACRFGKKKTLITLARRTPQSLQC